MASDSLLLLLLVSCSLLVPTENASTPAKHQKPGEASLLVRHYQPGESSPLVKRNNKPRPGEATPEDYNKFKAAGKNIGLFALKTLEQVLSVAVSVTSMVDGTPGKVATGILSLTLVGVSKLNEKFDDNPKVDIATLKKEIQSLKSTFAKYHVKTEWNTWAAGVYHKPEQEINVAWNMYLTMMNSLLETKDEKQRERHVREFVGKYNPKSVYKLHYHLIDKGQSFIRKLGDMLAEHVNCHEKDIRSYTDFISMLMFKGNKMNQLYYGVDNLLSEARLEEQISLAYDAISIMNEVHSDCASRSMVYVIKDVEEVIEAHKADDRQTLANEVWSRLNTAYDRYDWMVVAFKPKMSSHYILEFRNSHILTGFEPVQKDDVIVSVARQAKGPQTKIKLITDTIASCFEAVVQCYKVAKILNKCGKKVKMGGLEIPVVETYTAVHAFMWEKKAHQSHGAVKAPEEEWEEGDGTPVANSAQTPYIYTGVCKTWFKKGKFVVMIKSEEEILTKDPCIKLKCGGAQRGTCVRVPDVFVAMCKCKYPYFGDNCEKTVRKDTQ